MMSVAAAYDVLIVGGFGHVGLPLGIMLADAGFQVALYDVDDSKRASIEAGRMPFLEYDAEPILQRVIGKSLHVANGIEETSRSNIVVVTVGTPVDEYLDPKTKPIMELAERLVPVLRSGQCLLLRSTVYPGTTGNLNEFFKQAGIDVHVGCCPERIVQGYAIRELPRLPQIISGFTETAVEAADQLFSRLGAQTIRVTVQEAELAKLFSNAWRYIQFAIANQFYMIATEQGADLDRIYHAMTYEYERGGDLPRPGFAAGPCLLKDTLQLAAFYRNHFQLGYAAMTINEGLPAFLVDRLKQQTGGTLTGKRIGILGMAFKADTDDIRDSLSFKLAKILRFHGAIVVCSDEYAKRPGFVSKEELLSSCEVVIVGVPHSAYRSLSVPPKTTLIDLWRVIPERSAEASPASATTLSSAAGAPLLTE